MDRFQESQRYEYDERVELGKENALCIRGMQNWCKHFEIKQVSSGLYAEMSGLPIGWHKIGCPQAHGSESMNLPWICSNFLVDNCNGCTHHVPNGDTSWAQELIASRREAAAKEEQETLQRQEALNLLRKELREQTQEISGQTEAESWKIVQFLEAMFSDDETTLRNAVTYLEQSARLAPELFSEAMVNLLLGLAVSEEYADQILPVCSELARRRDDLHETMRVVALECIQRKLCVEKAASLIESLGNSVDYPLDDSVIERLMLTQNHFMPFGGWEDGKPEYPGNTALLVRCFDADPESLQGVVRGYLLHENEDIRVQLCGALQLIQQNRPQVVLNLLDELISSLELPEREQYRERPSAKIIGLLRTAFRHSPDKVDKFLGEAINRVRSTVQIEVVEVYDDQFVDRSLNWSERKDRCHTDDVSLAEQVAIRRLLLWLKDETLEISIRVEVADALETACRYATGAVLSEFDSLLGYVAIIVATENPPDGPKKIILPGQPVDSMHEHFDNLNRDQNWRYFKRNLTTCLENICVARPQEVIEAVCNCLENSAIDLSSEFKAVLVALLGKIGQHYELRPRIIPLIMQALMDYKSTRVRVEAVRAATEMFRFSMTAPPTNLVDIVVLHLIDSYVAVQQAAVDALRRSSQWLDDFQVVDAIRNLVALLEVYRDDFFQLKDICDALLSLGRRNELAKTYSIVTVVSVYPIGQKHVDSDVADGLTRLCKPSEPLAKLIAPKIASFLAQNDRDRYNAYSSVRQRMFKWLRALPPATFQQVEEDLINSACQLAERDHWESCQFAGLFSNFGAFQNEHEVLEKVSASLPQEARFADFRSDINRLSTIAAANSALLVGDNQSADAFFASVEGTQ